MNLLGLVYFQRCVFTVGLNYKIHGWVQGYVEIYSNDLVWIRMGSLRHYANGIVGGSRDNVWGTGTSRCNLFRNINFLGSPCR